MSSWKRAALFFGLLSLVHMPGCVEDGKEEGEKKEEVCHGTRVSGSGYYKRGIWHEGLKCFCEILFQGSLLHAVHGCQGSPLFAVLAFHGLAKARVRWVRAFLIGNKLTC